MGIQHHILAMLFLVRFDPNVPRVGAQRKAAETRTTVSLPLFSDHMTSFTEALAVVAYTGPCQAHLRYRARKPVDSPGYVYSLHGNCRL